jgi:hypothetical protein
MPKQDQTKVISAKDLGQLALHDFCPRCFWLERNLGKSPSIFPGIFSTLDSLSKRSVKRSFLGRNRQPDWLPLHNVQKHVEPPKMSVPVTESDWILTGVPDDVFLLSDNSYHIVDYKTARFTPTQDKLFPMYEVQLNAYAFAAPHHGILPVSKLSLIYCEPNEDLDSDSEFRITFSTHVAEIELKPEIIPQLLERARKILQNKDLPEQRFGCKKICAWARSLTDE